MEETREKELCERIAQLEGDNAKAQADKAKAEEEARIERERADRAVAASDRKKRTHTPKALPAPWQDPYAAKLAGTVITPGVLLAAAKIVLANLGPADFGPPPPNMDGVPQKGSKSVPRLHIRKYVTRALDCEPDGIKAAAEKIERKLDELMLTAREDTLRVFRVLVYLALVAQCGGDEINAQALWSEHDKIECWDPAAVGAEPETNGESTAAAPSTEETTAAGMTPVASAAAGGDADGLTAEALLS